MVEGRDLARRSTTALLRSGASKACSSACVSARCGSPPCCTRGRSRPRPASRLHRCRTRTRRRWQSRRDRPGSCRARSTPGQPQARRPSLPALNAAIAPLARPVPCSIGAVNSGCLGPQNGTSTQRVPSVSSHVAMAPHGPAAGELHLLVADRAACVDRRAMVLAAHARSCRAARCGIPCWPRRVTRGPCTRTPGR